MTQFVEQLRNQAKWYAQPGHNARDLMDSLLLEKAADEIECLRARVEEMERPAPSVPDGFAWPECPKRRQSHVLFDDGYEEGWATCVATIKAALASPEAKP